MRIRLVLPCLSALLTVSASAQRKVIAVIGSSTAAGLGASIPDSAWVNLAKKYWKAQGEIDTIYNLAVASSLSGEGMPTGSTPPDGVSPDADHNITKAMSFNPDIVIIAYPSNDIGRDFPLSDYLSNLRTEAAVVTAAGKVAYVTSTQPRDGFNTAERQNLQSGKDSILQEFGQFGMDFYTPLTDPATLGFIPSLTADGTHPNDAGHQLLFQVATTDVQFSTPLPLTLLGFKAFAGSGSILLQWTTASEQGSGVFDIQRSGDGNLFESIGSLSGKGQGSTYSFDDKQPLRGKNFYRVFISSGGRQLYSQVVVLSPASVASRGLIGRIFPTNGNILNVELNGPPAQPVGISVYSAGGVLIGKQMEGPLTPGAIVSIQLPALPAGVYYISVVSGNGHRETSTFSKL